MFRRIILALTAFCICSVELYPGIMQIRNVARPQGQRDNQLTGIGLVVGLNGTGDSLNTIFTQQAVRNLLENYGIGDPDRAIKTKNVAVVMVTARLESYLKNGDRIDVVVSSMGDSNSLKGGMLIQTPLKAVNGVVYAVAQGPVSVGESLAGRVGSLIARTHLTTARIPGGALVENEVPATVVGEDNIIRYVLRAPDYTTAARMAMAINDTFRALNEKYFEVARTIDAATIEVQIPSDFEDYPVEFMAALEQVEFEVEEKSNKVVVNERTGTVVMGMKVRLDTVVVAHGNLNVNVQVTNQVSQPNWFQPNRSALYFSNSNIQMQGGGDNVVTLPESSTVADLVAALNTIGATPRDLIAILQAIKEAGALQGELEIM
jgi:flagellar P-ring protein FlgI